MTDPHEQRARAEWKAAADKIRAERARAKAVAPSRQESLEMFYGDPADLRHGTLSAYTTLRCRCDRCREANTEYHRARRARKR